MSLAACLLAAASTGVSVSIGVRPTDDVPWGRIGLVAGAFGLTCVLAALRDAL
ncbi:hypothetical protein [Micromonospora cathayae]|uniref:Uncharacterized protein n=1 Tax=Micromonospora cathayae TaxID=3028804 RepID=A0ABY7ZI29_9ACTN|nr:hypothetical protein [Micromonospora sp. HUAS 3]WDZ82639.1 hypothetical protein PVK37_19420 [Micromonospora sp. HUAS 3]